MLGKILDKTFKNKEKVNKNNENAIKNSFNKEQLLLKKRMFDKLKHHHYGNNQSYILSLNPNGSQAFNEFLIKFKGVADRVENKPLLVYGPKNIGKSTLVDQTIKNRIANIDKQAIYLHLDFKTPNKDKDTQKFIKQEDGTHYILNSGELWIYNLIEVVENTLFPSYENTERYLYHSFIADYFKELKENQLKLEGDCTRVLNENGKPKTEYQYHPITFIDYLSKALSFKIEQLKLTHKEEDIKIFLFFDNLELNFFYFVTGVLLRKEQKVWQKIKEFIVPILSLSSVSFSNKHKEEFVKDGRILAKLQPFNSTAIISMLDSVFTNDEDKSLKNIVGTQWEDRVGAGILKDEYWRRLKFYLVFGGYFKHYLNNKNINFFRDFTNNRKHPYLKSLNTIYEDFFEGFSHKKDYRKIFSLLCKHKCLTVKEIHNLIYPQSYLISREELLEEKKHNPSVLPSVDLNTNTDLEEDEVDYSKPKNTDYIRQQVIDLEREDIVACFKRNGISVYYPKNYPMYIFEKLKEDILLRGFDFNEELNEGQYIYLSWLSDIYDFICLDTTDLFLSPVTRFAPTFHLSEKEKKKKRDEIFLNWDSPNNKLKPTLNSLLEFEDFDFELDFAISTLLNSRQGRIFNKHGEDEYKTKFLKSLTFNKEHFIKENKRRIIDIKSNDGEDNDKSKAYKTDVLIEYNVNSTDKYKNRYFLVIKNYLFYEDFNLATLSGKRFDLEKHYSNFLIEQELIKNHFTLFKENNGVVEQANKVNVKTIVVTKQEQDFVNFQDDNIFLFNPMVKGFCS